MSNPNADQVTRSFAETRFIENLQAASSSLPNNPTEPATDASATPATPETPPETIAPVVESPATPVDAAPLEPVDPIEIEVDDDFSADFIDAAPEPAGADPAPPDPNSPLAADAPQWQQDAYRRLQSDESLSAEDRETVAGLPPSKWDIARKWARDTKTFGKFRDKNVPINEVYDVLSRQSKDRTTELEVEALNRLVTDPSGEKMGEFSAKYPKVYTELLSGLITQHPEFVQEALKSKGYSISKTEAVDVDSALAEIKNNELWVNIEDTPLGDAIEEKLKVLAAQAAQAKPPEFTPEPASESSGDEAYQAAHTAITQVRDTQWLKAVGDGLASQGIRPASPEETRLNPTAAHLKNVVYTVALRGLPGVVPDWDEHSAQWGQKQDGFLATFQELTSYMQEGEYEKFQENAASMSPYYYEFGTRRANVPLIKKLYKAVEQMFGSAPTTPTPLTPESQTTTSPSGSPAPAPADSRFRTLSEKRFFEKRQAG